jgi:hypothetical protein
MFKPKVNKLKKKLHHPKLGQPQLKQPHLKTTGGRYFWIWAHDGGRRYVIKGGVTQEEAYERGLRVLQCPFDVVPLDTINVAEASRRLKGMDLDTTCDLQASVKRVRHNI